MLRGVYILRDGRLVCTCGGRRPYAIDIHEGGKSWAAADSGGAGGPEDGVEEGGFAGVGGPEEDDFGSMHVGAVLSCMCGRVEELVSGFFAYKEGLCR